MLDQELFDHRKEEKIETKGRCNFCGRDVERLFPWPAIVNQKTVDQIKEINEKNGREVQLIKIERCDPRLNITLDDMTLKPINGLSYHISLDLCFECIDKVGRRHKFKKKAKQQAYATQHL